MANRKRSEKTLVAIPFCQRCGKEWVVGATVEKETEKGVFYRCKCGAHYRVENNVLIQSVGDRTSRRPMVKEGA